MPMMMPIPGMKPMMKTKTDMTMPVLEKTKEPTMTDDEIVLWLITKATMEDKPVMRLAADRLIQMAQALREHDDLVECNEQFFVDNQFLKKRVEKAEAEWRRYESAWMTAEGKLEDAVQGLEKCQEELDAYSRQEYPLDHTVHERYRQRDYDANPDRITLAALKGQNHD